MSPTMEDVTEFREQLMDPSTVVAINKKRGALVQFVRSLVNQLEHELEIKRSTAHAVAMNELTCLASHMGEAMGHDGESFEKYARVIFDAETGVGK